MMHHDFPFNDANDADAAAAAAAAAADDDDDGHDKVHIFSQ